MLPKSALLDKFCKIEDNKYLTCLQNKHLTCCASMMSIYVCSYNCTRTDMDIIYIHICNYK